MYVHAQKLRKDSTIRFLRLSIISTVKYSCFNPLNARIFTVFVQFIRGQIVGERSMGCDPPCSWYLKG